MNRCIVKTAMLLILAGPALAQQDKRVRGLPKGIHGDWCIAPEEHVEPFPSFDYKRCKEDERDIHLDRTSYATDSLCKVKSVKKSRDNWYKVIADCEREGVKTTEWSVFHLGDRVLHRESFEEEKR